MQVQQRASKASPLLVILHNCEIIICAQVYALVRMHGLHMSLTRMRSVTVWNYSGSDL